jgi:hypothetical protein
MRVLITCGSKRGGTEGIGRMLADTRQQEGHRVELLPPEQAATALAFVGIVALLDLIIIAGLVQQSLALFGSILGLWLPLVSIDVATWATGELLSTLPWTRAPQKQAA